MILEPTNTRYLTDGDTNPIYTETFKSVHGILIEQGYTFMDISYLKKIKINYTDIQKHFEAVQNHRKLGLNNDNFGCFYEYWKCKDKDFYIKISSTESTNFSDYEDDEEALEEDQDSYRLTQLFYNPTEMLGVNSLLNEICDFNPSTSNKIDIIISTTTGYKFEEYDLKVLDVDINTMYNDDFKPVHEHIVDKLENGSKGIVLLHGEPGQGKTQYIKYLTTVIDKKFIFVPINMIEALASPNFIGDLVKNKGGILVIEDCENYIQDRDINNNTVVSSILQITDGILSDLLDIKVICTYNSDSTKVDNALKREGRLIAEYEFKELSDEKAEELAGKKVEGKKTLANIFNTLTYKTNKVETRKIGFGQ